MTHESDKRCDQVKHGDEHDENAYPDKSGRQRACPPQPDQVHTTTKSNTDNGSGSEKVHVVLPDEPPTLNPEAARALLNIIRRAYSQATAHADSTSSTQGEREDGNNIDAE